jgi:glycosyltransferase involved in cell wall biosynthesis
VVHAHWWFPNGLVGTWLAKMAHKPLVTTLHGTDVRLARSVAFSRPAFRHVMHNSAAVTAVSRWLANEAQEVVSAPAPIVAPMPVATDLFTPGGARRKDRLLFGMLGLGIIAVSVLTGIALLLTSEGQRSFWMLIETALILGSILFATGLLGEMIAGQRAQIRELRRQLDEMAADRLKDK